MLRPLGGRALYAGDMTTLAHSLTPISADVLAVFVSQSEDGKWNTPLSGELDATIRDAIARLGFEPGIDASITFPAPATSDYRTITVVSIPEKSGAIDPLRYAAGTATRGAKGTVVLVFPSASVDDSSQVLEGSALAATPAFTR
ncbi:MAG: hypothetical protein RLZZ587_545, partial [Actinomycetota bacterium]